MAKSVIVQRIERRLAEIKLGPVEAASTVEGLERNFIRDLIEDKKRSFSQAKAPLVAQALQWTVHDLMGDLAPPPSKRRPDRITRVPLLDYVQAGKLVAPSSQIPVEDVPLLAYADLGPGEWFALKVQGSSMDRVSPEDSTVIVNKRDRHTISGRCYIFAVDGEVTYKRWQGGDQPYLEPFSTDPLHKPRFFKKRDLEIIGRVKRSVLDL